MEINIAPARNNDMSQDREHVKIGVFLFREKFFRNMSEYVLTYADICYIIKTVKGDT